MRSKSILATLCSMLLVYASLAESATSAAIGTLSSDGRAELNGTVTTAGATIFAGDRIVNPDKASTALSLTGGSRLILAGLGSLQMKETGGHPTARLESGRLAVLSHANAPIVVEAAGTRIHGVNGDAVYAVTVSGNNLQVIASKGGAEVEGAGRTVQVSAGNTLDARMLPADSNNGDSGAPGAASEGALRFFTFERVVIIATAGASAAALGAAIKSLLRTCRVTGSPSTVSCD